MNEALGTGSRGIIKPPINRSGQKEWDMVSDGNCGPSNFDRGTLINFSYIGIHGQELKFHSPGATDLIP